jgi:hypothetical protein
VLRIAAVVRVRASAVIANAIMAKLGVPFSFMDWSCFVSRVVSINKPE